MKSNENISHVESNGAKSIKRHLKASLANGYHQSMSMAISNDISNQWLVIYCNQ
jgi:hypothetical protein